MIIVSITGPKSAESIAQVRRSRRFASIFEFRLDLMGVEDVQKLVRLAGRPVLLTCRPTWEGGAFPGGDAERLELLARASLLGASYVDLECRLGTRIVRRFIKDHPSIKVIVSQHEFGEGVKDPLRAYRDLRATGAYALKFAYRASDAADIGAAFTFLERAKRDKQPAVAIAMGEAGEATRILYRKFGGWATYAAPVGGPGAADGQISADLLHELFRADRLTASTKVFGVIGDPVRYSKGIHLHNPLFHHVGKNAVYCRFEVHALDTFMKRIAPRLQGISVTLPHKLSIIKHLDRIDGAARAIGAVNTVIRRGRRLEGSNTDGAGALDAIEHRMKVRGKTVLVIGAGGAARAIVFEAIRRGATVFIINRSRGPAEGLARASGAMVVGLTDIPSCDIVVNATSVGMMPATDCSPIPAHSVQMRLAFDAVYQPAETQFLRDAKEQGAVTVSGIEMYLHQAAAQSRLYTGIQPDLRRMRSLLHRVMVF
ncbi:MAG TPA: shikimate dehydrogenase [Bacteroidota bacterium]|nr:shikimate dehydrogenase [Bacteroidota bacterium]